MLRKTLCWMIAAAFPLSLFAADSGAAMLYTKGSAWLNGTAVPQSAPVFPGDLVQTKPGSLANINAVGSSVTILPDSMVKFDGSDVSVDHGGVSITTSKGMSTRAEDLIVTPSSQDRTEFEVRDTDGRVVIMARKGDLSINDGTATTTLPQGEQTTRDLSAKKRGDGGGAAPAAGGGILDSPIVVGVGAAAIGGLMVWVLTQSSQPASPSTP